MLGSSAVVAFVPSRSPRKSRSFYEQTLGLGFVSEDQFANVFDANDVMVRVVDVSSVEDFKPFPFTILGWQVNDIHKIVAEMTGDGVQFTRYPYLEQSPDGVWTAPGGAKVAWFTDPDGNTLSISQH